MSQEVRQNPNPIKHVSLVNGDSISQPSVFKGSTTNSLMPDTKGHPKKFCLHASMGHVPSQIHGGASMDWNCSGVVDSLRSLSCSYCHSWEVFAVWRGPMVGCTLVCQWVVLVPWYPHESQEPRFVSRTLHRKEMINFINFTWQSFYHCGWSMYGYSILMPMYCTFV